MKLKTILLFGIIGLIVSAPMLFSKANRQQMGNQSPQVTDAAQGGLLGRLFGGESSGPTATSNSPFQFASSSENPANNSPVSVSGNNTATPPPESNFSEPVYFAFLSLNEFLRFDVTPNWVKNRWPRVSTFPAQDSLTAMRVPLVSGPRPQDIHGSLTYFFDGQQQVQRIGFRGWTGDASELVNFVQQQGFVRQKSSGAGLFSRSSWGRNKGALRLDHPPVTQRELPTEQMMVLFELTNPSGNLQVSQKTQEILDAMEMKK